MSPSKSCYPLSCCQFYFNALLTADLFTSVTNISWLCTSRCVWVSLFPCIHTHITVQQSVEKYWFMVKIQHDRNLHHALSSWAWELSRHFSNTKHSNGLIFALETRFDKHKNFTFLQPQLETSTEACRGKIILAKRKMKWSCHPLLWFFK